MWDTNSNNTSNMTNGTECVSYRKSPSPVEESKASETFRTVFMAFIVFFSLVGNTLVLRGAITRRNRPFVYYLVINLSLAEIGISVLQPFEMVVERPPFIWEAGFFMCALVRSLEMCNTLVVTFTLAAIAVYRVFAITQPNMTRPSKKIAFGIMAISWIWGAAFAIPYGLNHKLFKVPDPCLPFTFKICRPVEESPVFDTAYKVAFFFVPFVVILASYGIVIYKIKQHNRSAQAARKESIEMSSVTVTRESFLDAENKTAQFPAAKPRQSISNSLKPLAFRVNSSVTRSYDKENHKNHKGKIFELEKDVLNILYILILVFFICYIPWTIMYILLEIAKVQSVQDWPYRWIFDWYATLIHALPSVLHPICYGAAGKVIGIRFNCFRFPCNKVM